jgi:outer membrane biosynthesis protein TonB
MTTWSRDPRRPARGAILASVVLHAVLVGGTWWAHRQVEPRIEYVTYEIQMFSMADLEEMQDVALQDPEDLVVQTPEDPLPPEPEPEPPPPDPDPDPAVQPDPPPPVEDPPPEREPPPERRDERTPPASEPPPVQEERTEATATADIAVRMEGLQRDFPVYYRNILTQIRACHRWDGGTNWETVVRFTITRDGRVPGSSIRLHERSGSTAFDLSAVGAVECAGAGRFGALPDDFPWEELPVQFTFVGRRGGS